jgi:D-alanine-D-alanine ligase
MKAKKQVVVMRGGMSAEHDVSMMSGQMVLDNLDADQYAVSSVEITQEGEWVFSDAPDEFLDPGEALQQLRVMQPDCVFIALHGPFGEDGRMQGLLDFLGIPYTGSGCAASALSMDKIRSKVLMQHAGFSVPEEMLITYDAWMADRDGISHRVEESLGIPCVVKNPWQGSSLGMAIPQTAEAFQEAVKEVFRYGPTLMVERFIQGTEVTCGVLDFTDDVRPVALPVTEIRPVKSAYFDYTAKYTPEATDEITPAEIDDAARDRVQEIAIRAHEIMGCRGFSRSDMILSGNDAVWLEINTIPGLTQTSLLPQAAHAAGISFSSLVSQMVEAALV